MSPFSETQRSGPSSFLPVEWESSEIIEFSIVSRPHGGTLVRSLMSSEYGSRRDPDLHVVTGYHSVEVIAAPCRNWDPSCCTMETASRF